jgi:glycerophosphoryl diester phosphodiesterase
VTVEQIGHVDAEFSTGVFSYTLTPDTIEIGDWMLAVVVTGQAQILPVPTGWTAHFNMKAAGTLSTAIFSKKRVAGETGYTFTFGGSTTSAKVTLMWFRGVADTGWIIPADGRLRNTTGSGTTNIADPITTTVANTLAVTISTERTTLVEGNISSMTGSTPWFFKAQNGSTQIETISVGTRNYAAPATTDSVSIVYPNPQTSNGWAIQIGLPSAPQELTGPFSLWQGGTEQPLTVTAYLDGQEVAVPTIEVYSGDYKVTDLLSTNPFYIAHRGGGDNWPEHTMRSYTGAVHWGLKAIEISVNITSDGVMVCHHDTGTNRMTGTNLTFATSTAAQLEPLTNTAAFTNNPTQDRQPIPLLVPVLDKFAHNHVCFVEAKTGGAWQATLLDLMLTYPESTERMVWKAPIVAGFQGAKDRGFTTWGYLLQNDPAHADWQTLVAKTDVDMIGVNHAASDQYISDVVALATSLGKKVIMWEIHSIADRDRAASLGVQGMMTSDLWEVLPKFP